jgi:hypothetical protein
MNKMLFKMSRIFSVGGKITTSSNKKETSKNRSSKREGNGKRQ